ncbi:MAG: hypothetical protein LW837_08695 [Roseomonas sp.]|nr:hypothetical protein [Roseomonas sp.]
MDKAFREGVKSAALRICAKDAGSAVWRGFALERRIIFPAPRGMEAFAEGLLKKIKSFFLMFFAI